MRDASPALVALLNGKSQFLMADLYTLTLADGSLLRYTSADTPLMLGSATFVPGPLIARDKVRLVTGIEVDEMQLTLTCDAHVAAQGQPLVVLAARGGLDGATVRLERAFMPQWGDTSAGALVLFEGRVSNVECTRWTARLTVRSFLELLDVQIPRMTYQAGCRHTLFDGNVSDAVGDPTGLPGCTVKRSEYLAQGHVTGTLDAWLFHDLTQPDGYFDLGVMTMTRGANAGVARTVKSYTYTRGGSGLVSHAITLMAPFPLPVAAGDTFTVVPGCDKTLATCQTKFNTPLRDLTGLGKDWRTLAWRTRFSGEPYIPAPESVL